ncbi:hypothetical protein U3516DRAFT_766765 [Neocallimastix sp. 'constans']
MLIENRIGRPKTLVWIGKSQIGKKWALFEMSLMKLIITSSGLKDWKTLMKTLMLDQTGFYQGVVNDNLSLPNDENNKNNLSIKMKKFLIMITLNINNLNRSGKTNSSPVEFNSEFLFYALICYINVFALDSSIPFQRIVDSSVNNFNREKSREIIFKISYFNIKLEVKGISQSTKIGGDIGECGQPESAEPEGFSNLKKVNNILVYCGKLIQNKRRPNTLNEELLNPTILEIQDKNLCEVDIQLKLNLEHMKNLYEDTINILNLEREQFNYWKENIIKENELNSSSQSKKINKLNCEIESLKLEEKEVSKFIVEVTREDIESNEEYNKN